MTHETLGSWRLRPARQGGQVGHDPVEGRASGPPALEVRRRNRERAQLRIRFTEDHQPVRIFVVERPEQDAVHQPPLRAIIGQGVR